MKFIIHYQLPLKEHEFVHRNGRTARMHKKGTAFILLWENENLPSFIGEVETLREKDLIDSEKEVDSKWETLFISGGRKDKISKGDISGLFMKQGHLQSHQIGIIELKQDCAFVAVKASEVNQLIKSTNNSRLKKKKVRISILN